MLYKILDLSLNNEEIIECFIGTKEECENFLVVNPNPNLIIIPD